MAFDNQSAELLVFCKVNRMDQDIRHMNERLIRLETMVEIAQKQSVRPERPELDS